MRKILVIGAGAAGMAAATRARRVDPEASIIVLESSQEYSRGTCSLPYYIAEEITERDSLAGISRQQLAEQRIDIKLGVRAQSIEPATRTALTSTGPLTYDRLIVSTGSRAKPVPTISPTHERLWTLRSIADADHIKEVLRRARPRKVAVIGGGYLGLEMAEVLTRRGCQVTLFHRQDTLMRLAQPCHQTLLRELEIHGVQIRTGSEVRLLDPDSRESTVEFQTADGSKNAEGFEAVLLSAGIEPEAGLLQRAGARIGNLGGVIVDSRGETSLSGVFAAGDGVELPSQRGGATRFVPLATSAARLGRVCGENAAGGSIRMPAALACIAVRIFNQQVAAVGHPADWIDAEAHTVDFGSVRSPFAKRRPGRATLLTERGSGRLLGAQIVAPEASAMADLASMALQQELTLPELLSFDASYTPPLSSLWHPFYLAARNAEKSRHPLGVAR